MSTNKSIFYLLCNKGIIVNLYKLYFLSSHFSFQPNKRVFHLPIFPPLQPITHKGKLNIFYPPIFSLLPPNRPLVNALSSHVGMEMKLSMMAVMSVVDE